MEIGYLIPEFPAQTHIWMWREITRMRELGVEITIFSTRPPRERDRARHAFSGFGAESYRVLVAKVLWGFGWWAHLGNIGKAKGVCAVCRYGCEYAHAEAPSMESLVPLIVPACLLARG